MTDRQIILGQYIHTLIDAGIIKAGMPVADVLRAIVTAVREDSAAVLGVVGREYARRVMNQVFDSIFVTEMKKR